MSSPRAAAAGTQQARGVQEGNRQHRQPGTDVGVGRVDAHRAVDSDPGQRGDSGCGVGDQLPGDDVDLAARPTDRVGDDLAVLQDYELRVDKDVAALTGAAPDRCGDLAVHQVDQPRREDLDVAAARIYQAGGGNGAALHLQAVAEPNFDRARLAAAQAAGRNRGTVVQLQHRSLQCDVTPGTVAPGLCQQATGTARRAAGDAGQSADHHVHPAGIAAADDQCATVGFIETAAEAAYLGAADKLQAPHADFDRAGVPIAGRG